MDPTSYLGFPTFLILFASSSILILRWTWRLLNKDPTADTKWRKKTPRTKMVGGGRNPAPPWIELPTDLTVNILLRLGPIEIIETAQKVCTTWRRVCKDPSMWGVIDMENPGNLHEMPYCLETLCRHAVDRSQGQLIDTNIEYFGTNRLMDYISHRSSRLRRLTLVHSHDISGACLVEAVKRFPKLEELSLIFMKNVLPKDIETIVKSCPLLKSFTLVESASRHQWTEEFIYEADGDAHAPAVAADGADFDAHALAVAADGADFDEDVAVAADGADFDEDAPAVAADGVDFDAHAPAVAADGADGDAHALAVVKGMPNLHHLAFVANNMKNEGLQAILDGCCRLQSLDIRKCFGVDLKGALGKRCSKQIKRLRLPSDRIEDVGWLIGFCPSPQDYHNWPEWCRGAC